MPSAFSYEFSKCESRLGKTFSNQIWQFSKPLAKSVLSDGITN